MLPRFLLCAVLASSAALANPVSLTGDYSFSNGNPNGQWSYTFGASPLSSSLLSVEIPVNNGNSFVPVFATGYWSTGNNLNASKPES